MDTIDLEKTLRDKRNISHSYHLEVIWKRGRLREGHWYINDLAANGERCRELCTEPMIELVEQARAEVGATPTVLDVGCGPVSSYAFLAHEGLAELTGVDPLADRYQKLLGSFGLSAPERQVDIAGERLTEEFGPESFDIVSIRNALDHHLCPALAWLNIFRAAKVGGYIVQSHSIREATKENWRQLHQYDLFPADDEGALMIEDARGVVVDLVSGLPLEHVSSKINRRDDGHGWMTVTYRKTGTEEAPEMLQGVIDMLGQSLEQRHRWATRLERRILKAVRSERRERRHRRQARQGNKG